MARNSRLKAFWASRVFGYGDKWPSLDVGQVIEIEPGQERNDEKLIRLGLLKEVTSTDSPVDCGKCEARFLNDSYLNRHGKLRHEKTLEEIGREEVPNADLEQARELGRLRIAEAQDELASKTIPLNMEKTKATIDASA